MVGTTFIVNGVKLTITEVWQGEYFLASPNGGVWTATAAQLEAAGVTVV